MPNECNRFMYEMMLFKSNNPSTIWQRCKKTLFPKSQHRHDERCMKMLLLKIQYMHVERYILRLRRICAILRPKPSATVSRKS